MSASHLHNIYVCVYVWIFIIYWFRKHNRIILRHVFKLQKGFSLSFFLALSSPSVTLTFFFLMFALVILYGLSFSLSISWFLKATNTFPHIFLLLSLSISLKSHTIITVLHNQNTVLSSGLFSVSLRLMLTHSHSVVVQITAAQKIQLSDGLI